MKEPNVEWIFYWGFGFGLRHIDNQTVVVLPFCLIIIG